MAMRVRALKVLDLFCGAGGLSEAAKKAVERLGFKLDLVCANHWTVAVDTHSVNHPDAIHFCQDVATLRPLVAVPCGWLDLLIAAPTCTYHSRARGGRPTSDQQRMDPWHIIPFLTELRVKRLLIENVPEIVKWGPVDPRTGKPIKGREGEYFRAWIGALRACGMVVEWRIINCADYGDPTTRERFILIGRSDGLPLAGSWPAPTHAEFPVDGLKPWNVAASCIDWSIRGRSIYNRKKPLAANTVTRIYNGAVKLGWPERYLIRLRRHMKARGIPIPATKPRKGEVAPFMLVLRNHADGRSLQQPFPPVLAAGTHLGLVEPVFYNGRRNGRARGVNAAPVPALDTKGGIWLAAPGDAEAFVLSSQSNGAARAVRRKPFAAITANGGGKVKRDGCARPILVEPQPFVLSRQGGGAARPLTKPTPTQAAKHSHIYIEPSSMLAPYYGSGSGKTCSSVLQPIPALTTKDRFGLVVPVTHSKSKITPRGTNRPFVTLTTAKGGELALSTPANDNDDIYMRMLETHELALAMSLGSRAEPYKFTGTKTQVVKQIGNAVPRETGEALIYSLLGHGLRQHKRPRRSVGRSVETRAAA